MSFLHFITQTKLLAAIEAGVRRQYQDRENMGWSKLVLNMEKDLNRNYTNYILCLIIVAFPIISIAATEPEAISQTTGIAQLESYAKLFGALLGAIALLVGLPVGVLTYKKTNIEIRKIQLEAEALERKSQGGIDRQASASGIQVAVEHSKDVNIQVLADPRFLAPLLIVLDFIFASIVLALMGYIFVIVGVGIYAQYAKALLGFLLYFPIAAQAVKVRGLLLDTNTDQELLSHQNLSRTAVSAIYLLLSVTILLFGVLLFVNIDDQHITNLGKVLAVLFSLAGLALLAGYPFVRRKYDNYLLSLKTHK